MDIQQFVDYCLKFYGPGGLNPISAMTREELEQATRKHIASGADFAGDSFDREAVRDIMLEARGEV